MKRSELFIAFSLVPLDALAIFAAFVLAYFTRIQSDVVAIWDFSQYIQFILLLIPFWILLFATQGIYKIASLKRGALDDLQNIFFASSSGIMLVVVYIFLSKTDFFSRLIVLYAWVYVCVILMIIRIVTRIIRRQLLKYGVGVYRVIVVGDGVHASAIINAMNTYPQLGYKVVKVIDRDGLAKIETILSNVLTDEIVLADSHITDKNISHLLEVTHGIPLTLKVVPNTYRLREANVVVDTVADIPLLSYSKTQLDGWGAIIKRIIDIIGSLCAIIILSPISALIALIIACTDRGPVIYKNERVGHEGNFITYKFRSMYIEYCTGKGYGGEKALDIEKKLIKEKNIKSGSAVYKIANDPRITPIGNFIRKTSLDELPQFYNVLIGTMSLVGPRPHQPREVENYTPQQRKLLIVKPGLTGMAQISGRSNLTFDDEARLDILYIENWSLWMDVKIILRTFFVIFKGKGAY